MPPSTSPQPVLDPSIIKDLSNHIYEKRKATAFQIESITKSALSRNDSQTIYRIIHELTTMTMTSGSNSAKMGAITALGSVSVAVGSFAIAYFLDDIIRPIFATFRDTDARVRYYACESLYNVAKIARGEILLYINEIFDVLCILVSDAESSVKNAADILDRLVKDIISAKATSYVSILQQQQSQSQSQSQKKNTQNLQGQLAHNGELAYEDLLKSQGSDEIVQSNNPQDPAKAFSLPKFMPTLLERMYTVDPFTKKFLLSWLELFDDIPNLELISFLPSFLKPLVRFIFNNAPSDIKLETQNLLNVFLKEIQGISRVKIEYKHRLKEQEEMESKEKEEREKEEKQVVSESKDKKEEDADNEVKQKLSDLSKSKFDDKKGKGDLVDSTKVESSKLQNQQNGNGVGRDDAASIKSYDTTIIHKKEEVSSIQNSTELNIDRLGLEEDAESDEVTFGQDIYIDYSKIISILVSFLHEFEKQETVAKNDLLIDSRETYCDVQFIALKWLQALIDVSPQDVLNAMPECVSVILKNITVTDQTQDLELQNQLINVSFSLQAFLSKVYTNVSSFELFGINEESLAHFNSTQLPQTLSAIINEYLKPVSSALTTAFTNVASSATNDNELSRITSLEWLIFIYEHNPNDFLKFFQSTDKFELTNLLKYDSSNEVILKVLQLLAKISESNPEFFKDFIIKLLKLIQLEGYEKSIKVEFIIRKLCLCLDSEIIFTTLSEVLQQHYHQQPSTKQSGSQHHQSSLYNDKDANAQTESNFEFANMLIVTLNNILLTSSELSPFRKKLKNLDLSSSKDWLLFATLFKSWCFNAPSAIALCLLTSNYELSYLLIKNLSELEVTSQLLTQLDVLIQLLESPIFVKLRLQLLEPENHPFLYKTLYGILMVLPQSSTFMTLRNRLSVCGVHGVSSGGAGVGGVSVPEIKGELSLRRKRINELLERFKEINRI
ncbi:uncharacterized protein CPAR2_206010 [Candida parapsilosis]|uniref:Vac14_Fig4_bd domain-containing protein n=1 Tax=Candida parapsilosis (strain CDC 317 / ATCC MYA-4646) TaxID=578454 RepID=G8BGH5_CANPC|nr:uncharacterized protein CPAR2_206010 [Candida parapsilosis]CCE42959.1 hypothetical protein CPAR2_206010 [Candida parapsilosis]